MFGKFAAALCFHKFKPEMPITRESWDRFRTRAVCMCCCNQTNGPHSGEGEVNSSSITSDVSDCMLYFVIWYSNLSNSNAIVYAEDSKAELCVYIFGFNCSLLIKCGLIDMRTFLLAFYHSFE